MKRKPINFRTVAVFLKEEKGCKRDFAMSVRFLFAGLFIHLFIFN